MNPTSRNNLRKVFATNVKRLRLARGWSQEQLAAEARLHRTYVGAIERAERNVSIDNIERLSEALDVQATVLVRNGDLKG